MYAVARLISRGVYTVSGPFHPFGGAVDIIVVQQPDGSFKSSPWYVRFGKFQGVLKTREKVVTIDVNGVEADFHMYLDHKGEAYFLSDEVGKEEQQEEGTSIFSPPSSSGEETDEQLLSESSIESKSCNFDATQKNSSDQNDKGEEKIVRTNSRRARLLGLVWGRKSMKNENGSGEASVERWDSLERAEIAADLLEAKWSTNRSIDEVTNSNSHCSNNSAQDLEVSVTSDVAEREKESSVTLSGLQNPDDETKMVSISGAIVDLQNPHLDGLVGASSEPVIERVSNESNGLLGDGVYEEEIRKERVSSYIYCETSESSLVGVGSSGDEKVQVTTELISEVNSQPGAGALMIKEIINELGLSSDETSCKNYKTEDINGTCITVQTEDIQVTEPKIITDRLIDGDKLESERVEEFENQSRITKFSYSCTSSNNELGLEEPSVVSQFQVQMVCVDPILSSVDDKESPRICTSSNHSSPVLVNQEEESFGEENKRNIRHSPLEPIIYHQRSGADYLPTDITNSSIPENSEEDQFLFSDIGHFTSSAVLCKDAVSSDFMSTIDHPLASMDDIEYEHDSNDTNRDSLSSSAKLVQEFPSVTFPALLEESRTKSSALSIPSGRKGPLEVEWVGSLPNYRSHIDNLEISDVRHPVSCSLDSGSKSLRWELFKKEGSVSFKSDTDTNNDSIKQHGSSDTCKPQELKRISTIPGIEVSLCKHLLSEGMGADAASRAFDAEKVDLEQFVSLASAPLKNDRLVVRIGGRYFPWDAAVPIISEMALFGYDQNFEPEGMISVDHVEETLEGLSPRTIVAAGGSWRPWPFRRSKTIGADPGFDGIKASDADNASVSSSYLTPDKIVHNIKVTEKKVRSIVPTSEQLASLNLKEGQNVITFTFSTAMLGKQQVDARIYLMKWNARIVVSDVDGTITKSDVLGQFMPLVGKDWSQTGVAHLFSAIEENGYKFLYLSARSVSQAYLTRQFLINLKQDGKALPDGPVVISPDGLFPSLFREVIRRAPHEFKIPCLEDIKALFPPDCNPFYAGFGNRATDEFSYLKVGIPKGKIFTINPKGEVAVNRRVDTKSYTSLHALVNAMFPAMFSAGQEEFNSHNFWKVPLPHLDI